jgi:hypothetical protein
MGHYNETRKLPFFGCMSTRKMIVYLPFFAMLSQLFKSSFYIAGDQSKADSNFILIRAKECKNVHELDLLLALSFCLTAKGWVRFSPLHMALAIIPALFYLVWLSRTWLRGKSCYDITGFISIVSVVMISVSSWIALKNIVREIGLKKKLIHQHLSTRSEERELPNWRQLTSEVQRFAHTLKDLTVDREQLIVAERLRVQTKPDELVFIGNHRHDKIFANDVALYFIADRKPATRWYHFDPGLQTDGRIQQEMVQDLQSSKTRWIVLCDKWADFNEPNASSVSSGVRTLDHHIELNYTLQETYGRYSLWTHR